MKFTIQDKSDDKDYGHTEWGDTDMVYEDEGEAVEGMKKMVIYLWENSVRYPDNMGWSFRAIDEKGNVAGELSVQEYYDTHSPPQENPDEEEEETE